MMIGLLLLLLLLLLPVVVEEEVDEDDLVEAAVPDGEMMAPPRGWKARRRLPLADDGSILFMWPRADDDADALLLLPATTEAIAASKNSSTSFEVGDMAEFVLKRLPPLNPFLPAASATMIGRLQLMIMNDRPVSIWYVFVAVA